MKKEKWSSEFGFLMAASGSAVGLGNLWKFPYITGENGGGIFIFVYFVLLFLLGVPVLLSEMAIGRNTRKNPVDACRSIGKGCGFIGAFGVFGAFFILSYYCVVGGWIMKYLQKYIFEKTVSDAHAFFEDFTTAAISPLIYAFIFVIICAFIVIKGISSGIEKISCIFMPALFVMMIILTFRTLSLEGGIDGLKFFLIPDFSQISSFPQLFKILISAMGQVFFSLSLGMGTLITYGAYLDRKTKISKVSFYIPLIDFVVALLSGLMILPAVFAYNIPPQAGSGMIFIALPSVFAEITAGRIFAVIFFLLVLFAAITSAISLFEVIISFLMYKAKISRVKAAVLCASLAFIAGIPVSLSFGKLSDLRILEMNFYDLVNFISDKLLMPLGALGICILCGYIWGSDKASDEADIKSSIFRKLYRYIIRYAAPAMIAIIFVTSLIGV